MASGGQTGAHIPHPLQTELFTTAISLLFTFLFSIASKGQASRHLPHHEQLSSLITAIIGSVSSVPLLTYENDFVAADSAEFTDSEIFLGPWHAPAMVIPSITVSTGRNFICTSL